MTTMKATNALLRAQLVETILASWGVRAMAKTGHYLIGQTKKNQPICLCIDKLIGWAVLKAMYAEAKEHGLDTSKVFVYGSVCTIGGSKSLVFTQVNPATGEVYW